MKKASTLFAAAFLLFSAFGLMGCGDHTDAKDLPVDHTGQKPNFNATDNAAPGPGNKGGIKPPPP